MKKLILMVACCFLAIFLFGLSAEAFWLDEDHTCWISGELQTRGSWRMDDTEGFTSPNVGRGNLVQHRNLFYTEIKHDLKKFHFPADLDVK